MKLHALIQNSCLLLISVIAFSSPVQAADASGTQYARAIGGETPAAPPPKKKTVPAAPPKEKVAKPAEEEEVAEEGTSKAKIGIGIAIAAALAALAGGGSPPHP